MQLAIQTTGTNQTFSINISSGSGVNLSVDWGDGLGDIYASTGIKTHTYSSPGNYVIGISGSFANNGNIRLGNGAAEKSRLISTGAFPNIPGLTNFLETFRDCTALTSIPENLFRYNNSITTFGFWQTFRGCSGLTSIPTNLFRYNTNLTTDSFYGTFLNCTGLTSIPEDLFRYNNLVTADAFKYTFYGCTGLTSIPQNLFRYNTEITSYAFNFLFYNCTGLTSLPVDLFRYNTKITTNAFWSAFANCTNLTSVPADIFRYQSNMSGTSSFSNVFSGVTLPTSVYDQILISLNNNLIQSNLGFNAGSSKYSSSGSAARSSLIARGWVITDGGLQ